MIDASKFEITQFPDGALCLSCGDGMESDLIFASGAMHGDPDLERQREILEFIMAAIRKHCINYKYEADSLLAAAAAGDDEAARMYDVANWLAIGGEVDPVSKAALDAYIARVREKGSDAYAQEFLP